jgi:DNA-binding transcriptional LysR family regulator
MRLLAQAHPEVRPSVLEIEGPPAERELRTGGIDLVISERDAADPAPNEAGIAVQALADDPYRVVCPATWAVRPRSVPDLADIPWVAGPPDSACGQALLRLAAEHHFTPRIAHTCLEFPAVLALVEAGFGAAIVPVLALPDSPDDRVVVTDIPVGGARRLAAAFRSARSGVEPVVAVTVDALAAAATRRGLAPPTAFASVSTHR